jgi:hypothetical protein
MPVTAALAVQNIDSAAAANAMIASILYDVSTLARLQEGTDFYRLTLGDFNISPLPGFLKPPAPSLPIVATGPLPLYASARVANVGALVVRGSTLTFVGQHEYLHAKSRPFGHLPYQPWAPDSHFTLGPGQYQCCACSAPIGGDVIVVRAPRAPPATNPHREWWYSPRPHGSLLLLGDVADKSLLLCLTCWNALDSPECLTRHMQAIVSRTLVPHTQAEACAQCPGYEGLAWLLAGSVRNSTTKGAFIVKMADGSELVLAGDNLGPLPALTDPEIASLGLPVLASLRLAEDPSGAAGGTVRNVVAGAVGQHMP